ncbi:DUF389 domain-containing protein [Pontibacter kalidii]|uniref:DUF389 domain-containing protein n=1 Tax=Pontibacter kalidii TaxID=2592049 RepID=UPI0022515B4C|nr:DUF389 domain-containing protein [Pontibacter kalidii]
MPRKVEITLPSAQTDNVLDEIRGIKEVISLRLQRGVSLTPPGDVISLEVTDHSLHSLMQLLDRKKMLQNPEVSLTTSQPLSIVSQPSSLEITNDTSEATWEEMQSMISRESNMTTNGLMTMVLSGIIAVVGISTNALHLVVGAMVVAPAFEPIVRIPLGLITSNIAWRRGVTDTLKGYAVLIAAAALTTFVLQALGQETLDGKASYLAEGALLSYWTSISVSSALVSAAAGLAGALVIAAHKSVLTAGVMIALALIPSAALMGMALAAGEWNIAEQAALRWLLDVTLVAVFSAIVFLWKKSSLHKRNMQS